MTTPSSPTSRRGLLFGTAAVGAAAVAFTAIPSIKPEVAAAPALKPAPEKGGGYALTEHVKHYYRTALI
jgi:hypothetical protein